MTTWPDFELACSFLFSASDSELNTRFVEREIIILYTQSSLELSCLFVCLFVFVKASQNFDVTFTYFRLPTVDC